MEDFNSKYTGQQVEDLLDQVASGNAGGGGGITVETDPIFSASPAASITEDDKEAWNNKVPYSSKDFIMVSANGFMTSEGEGFVLPNTHAAQAGQGFVLATLEDIPNALTESDITSMGFTKNTGTYSKPSGGIPKSDLATSVQESLSKAESAALTRVIGGMTAVEAHALDDGAMVYATPSAVTGDEDDILLTKNTVKTINGESIVGSGDITIAGGSGEKGDKGDTGVGVQSVTQTTTSNADGGSNVVTVALTDGTKSTFTVKNGSKGSQGVQGEQGPKGDTGATGANGKDGADGTNGKDGTDGADGATFTPSVDSAGNLSWSNDKGLANPPTVNIKGPKGDKGDAGEGGGSSGGGGVETIYLSGGLGSPLIIEEMLAEKRYYLYVDSLDETEQSIVIGGFEGDGVDYETHIRHFYAVIECVSTNGDTFNVSLSLPDVEIRWSTGIPIPIRGDGRYELSITQVADSGYAYYNAVLTSFS